MLSKIKDYKKILFSDQHYNICSFIKFAFSILILLKQRLWLGFHLLDKKFLSLITLLDLAFLRHNEISRVWWEMYCVNKLSHQFYIYFHFILRIRVMQKWWLCGFLSHLYFSNINETPRCLCLLYDVVKGIRSLEKDWAKHAVENWKALHYEFEDLVLCINHETKQNRDFYISYFCHATSG